MQQSGQPIPVISRPRFIGGGFPSEGSRAPLHSRSRALCRATRVSAVQKRQPRPPPPGALLRVSSPRANGRPTSAFLSCILLERTFSDSEFEDSVASYMQSWLPNVPTPSEEHFKSMTVSIHFLSELASIRGKVLRTKKRAFSKMMWKMCAS
ncbi:hypothetical protein HPB48_015216 [Haemaphysalis longicornis]|uniref:Uncharacterized protein n=1 Tax=Haemaphysalis longicornis TaxID=44386 RepID=A0A9J6FII5_HAELO|nr:hypothetical protein HPB48_015216 [Haemaphysalis longicornis]